MRSGALCAASVLMVTLINDPPVFVIRVPDLGAVPAAALSALDLARKNANAAVALTALSAVSTLRLGKVENLGRDDCGVAVFKVILRKLTFVFLLFFGKITHGVCFLENLITMARTLHFLKSRGSRRFLRKFFLSKEQIPRHFYRCRGIPNIILFQRKLYRDKQKTALQSTLKTCFVEL